MPRLRFQRIERERTDYFITSMQKSVKFFQGKTNLVGLRAVDYVIVMLAFLNQTKGAAPNDAAPLVSADRTR